MSNKGLDSAKSLVKVATQLVAKGYTWVARYYFKSSKFKDVLTKQEATALATAGLYVVAVYENGFPIKASYFTAAQGNTDAMQAVRCAVAAGQPINTPIYFAVDYDSNPHDIVDYFQSIKPIMDANHYSAGIYGNGVTIERLKSLGLVSHGWLSQSRGFQGYKAELPKADIVQTAETTVLGFDIDGDYANGHSGAWKPV